MINKNILSTTLTDKFTLLTLHSIVNECFINGLPLNHSEISDDEKITLTKYSYKVLNRVGGFRALENAISSHIHNDKQKTFMHDIYTVCKETATEAAKRIVTETDVKNPETKFEEVVDRAALTDDEYKKFVTKAGSLNLDAISDIIKEKTLNVLKDEQEQYEKEEELHEELKDALADSKDFSETTTESYMDIVLTKADPRHHVSLFSKLQETAYEMTMITPVLDGTDVTPLIDRVTFESFLEPLRIKEKDLDKWYESYVETPDERVVPVSDENKAKVASLVSIIVYSVMETLKTLHIYNPSQDDVKKFICSTADGEKVKNVKAYDVYLEANEMLKEANCLDYSKVNDERLTTLLTELKKISEILETFVTTGAEGIEISKVNLTINLLREQMEHIDEILSERLAIRKEKIANEGTTTYYGELQKNNDISQFNKIGNLFSSNPLVKEIRLKVDPNNMSSIIDVEAANESHQVIKSSFMNMMAAVESAKYFEYLGDIFKQSKLADTEKSVCIVVNDGTGRKITLN